jgi:hypothetical protein
MKLLTQFTMPSSSCHPYQWHSLASYAAAHVESMTLVVQGTGYE